ncbi:MAG: hypothetical protein ACK5UE_11685 [Chitinophagales bacterium]|jgi:hypothetical protein
MKKIFLTIIAFLMSFLAYSQDSLEKSLTKIRLDLQGFGNSPVFSVGVSKSILLGEKSLIEARLGAGFYFEFKDNKYPTESGDYWYEKNQAEPAYSIPLEFTYTPNYKKKISFSLGAAYNFFHFSNIYLINDPLSPQFGSFRHFVHRMFFSAGADYIIKKKLYLGIRLLSPYDFEKGFATPFTTPYPSIRYKF